MRHRIATLSKLDPINIRIKLDKCFDNSIHVESVLEVTNGTLLWKVDLGLEDEATVAVDELESLQGFDGADEVESLHMPA